MPDIYSTCISCRRYVRKPHLTSKNITRPRKRGEVLGNYISKNLQLKIWLVHHVIVYRKRLMCNGCLLKDVSDLTIDSSVAINCNTIPSAVTEFLDYASRNTCIKTEQMTGLSLSKISTDRCYTLCGLTKKQITQVLLNLLYL